MADIYKSNNYRVKVFSINKDTGWAVIMTERQVEILQLLSEGLSSLMIEEQMFLSHRTFQREIANIFQKMDVKNRTHAVIKAYRAGLIK